MMSFKLGAVRLARRSLALVALLITSLIVVSPAALGNENWPQFRGPQGDGRAKAVQLPGSWGGLLEPPVWNTELPGLGWSSPIVVNRRIWMTTATTTALSADEQKTQLEATRYSDQVNLQADGAVECWALELDPVSGKLLRKILLLTAARPRPIHAHNSYASPTPVADGDHVYFDFGSLGTVAVEQSTGKILWQRTLGIDDISGPATSPVLCDNLLILVRDGCDKQQLLALDRATGRTVWTTDRPQQLEIERQYRRSFATPLLIDVDGKPQLIAPTSNWAISYDPRTGRELWRAKLPTGHALVPRPVYAPPDALEGEKEGFVFVCSGYYKPQLVAIAVGGTGDVSKTHIRWMESKQAPALASPIFDNGLLYMVSDLGIATCMDAVTGEVQWRERLQGTYAASPLLADGKLYFFGREGLTTVLRPGRTFKRLAENRLSGAMMASPAVFQKTLLIRAGSTLYGVQRSEFEPLP